MCVSHEAGAGTKCLKLTSTYGDVFPPGKRPYVFVPAFRRRFVCDLVRENSGVGTPSASYAEDTQANAREPDVLRVQLIAPLTLKGRAME